MKLRGMKRWASASLIGMIGLLCALGISRMTSRDSDDVERASLGVANESSPLLTARAPNWRDGRRIVLGQRISPVSLDFPSPKLKNEHVEASTLMTASNYGTENDLSVAKTSTSGSGDGFVRSCKFEFSPELMTVEGASRELTEGSSFTVKLTDGSDRVVNVSRTYGDSGNYSVLGKLDGEEINTVTYVVAGDKARMEIFDPETNRVYVAYDAFGEGYVLNEYDKTGLETPEGGHVTLPQVTGMSTEQERAYAEATGGRYLGDAVIPQAIADATASNPFFIHVIIYYDQTSRAWLTSERGELINVFSQSQIAKSNLALLNSGCNFAFRMARSQEVDYYPTGTTDGGYDMQKALEELKNNLTYSYSDTTKQYKADLAVLMIGKGSRNSSALIQTSTFSIAGLGLMNTTKLSTFYGISCCVVDYAYTGYTMVHEMGHNLGANHARNQTESPANLNESNLAPSGSYGMGWYFTDRTSKRCATIMAYEQNNYLRVPIFSSPTLYYKGGKAGDETYGDNVGVFSILASKVAATSADEPVYAKPILPTFTLETDVDKLDLTKGAQTATLNVSSNTSWQVVSSAPSWLKVSSMYNKKDLALTLTLTANAGEDPRMATIVLKGGGLTKTVLVTQEGTSSEDSGE